MENPRRSRPGAPQADAEVLRPESHIYVHVPFCVKKCSYCSFYSVPYSEPVAARYLEALSAETGGRLPRGARPRTIHVGGGTPTALSASMLSDLLEIITSRIDTSELEEFAVEANPGTLTGGKIAVLKRCGVNRISLGVQSFDEGKLRLLGRVHGGREAREAFHSLREAGFENLGVDLIYGVPGDTESAWLSDLEHAAALEPDHISTYCLSFEPGTALAERMNRGELIDLEEHYQKKLYYKAVDFLASRDYEHYEISNFARRGLHSRHNLATWRYEPYAGLGPAAASFDGRTRRRNAPDIEPYCSNPQLPAETEKLTEAQRAAEVMMLALRTREGISARQFEARCGLDLDETFGDTVHALEERGLLEKMRDTSALRLARKALFVSDEVFMEFF